MGKENPGLQSTARVVLAVGFILAVTAHASTTFTTRSAGNTDYMNFNPAATNLFRNVTQINRAEVAEGVSAVTFTNSDESLPAMDLNGAASNNFPSADLLFLYNGEAGLNSADLVQTPTPVQSENALGFNNALKNDRVVGWVGSNLMVGLIGSNASALSFPGPNQPGISVISLPQLGANAANWIIWEAPDIGSNYAPEPATWMLIAGGLSGLALLNRRPGLFSGSTR